MEIVLQMYTPWYRWRLCFKCIHLGIDGHCVYKCIHLGIDGDWVTNVYSAFRIFSQTLFDFKKSISGPIELKFSGETLYAIL